MRVRWPAIQRLSMAVISEETGDAAASGGGGAAAGAAGLGRPSGTLAGMDRGAMDTLCTAGRKTASSPLQGGAFEHINLPLTTSKAAGGPS